MDACTNSGQMEIPVKLIAGCSYFKTAVSFFRSSAVK